MAQYDVDQVVRGAVADTLGVTDLAAADLDASLVDDLGLESLDLVDILFRIERALPVRLPLDWLSELLQGAVRDEEFCTENGVVTDSGLDRLAAHLPQLQAGRWSGRLRVEHIPSLVTVRNLIELLRWYGVDLLDYHRGALSARRLRVLIEHLPREASLVRAVHGDDASWGLTEHLIATAVDQLTTANWQFAVVHATEGSSTPDRPPPIPRPGVADATPDSATPDQLAAFFTQR